MSVFLILTFVLATAGPAHSLEILISGGQVQAGEELIVPVALDQVDNLAGLKLVLVYEKNLLTYKSTKKARSTASLMHVVNDREPGQLIIVMAGARGIKGKDLVLFDISFEASSELKKQESTQITVKGSQLMSDQLQNLDHTSRSLPITITARAAPGSLPAVAGAGKIKISAAGQAVTAPAQSERITAIATPPAKNAP